MMNDCILDFAVSDVQQTTFLFKYQAHCVLFETVMAKTSIHPFTTEVPQGMVQEDCPWSGSSGQPKVEDMINICAMYPSWWMHS